MSIPVMELESRSLLERFGNDRPVFHGRVARGMQPARFFQLFACKPGFLCLELTYKRKANSQLASIARWMAAIYFGPLAIIAQIIMSRQSRKREAQLDLSNTLLSNDELIELARVRKRSFVARYDDIKWARIEAPDPFERFFCGASFQGTLTFRETTVGKVTMYLYDRQAMETAIEELPRRLGERADIRAKFNSKTQRFVAKSRPARARLTAQAWSSAAASGVGK